MSAGKQLEVMVSRRLPLRSRVSRELLTFASASVGMKARLLLARLSSLSARGLNSSNASAKLLISIGFSDKSKAERFGKWENAPVSNFFVFIIEVVESWTDIIVFCLIFCLLCCLHVQLIVSR